MSKHFFLVFLCTLPAAAVPIASHFSSAYPSGRTITGYDGVGQSFTTGASSYDHFVFQFVNATTGLPEAPGSLYLFGSSFAGTAGDLATAPGVLASAVGSLGAYVFDPLLVLSAGSTYYVYSDSGAGGLSFDFGSGFYGSSGSSGGSFEARPNLTAAFTMDFLAQGDVVGAPELDGTRASLCAAFVFAGIALLSGRRVPRGTLGTGRA